MRSLTVTAAPSSRRGALVALFVLSGASGIIFEVLWIRIFTSILGSSTQSVGAIVTAFMLGIGVGQAVFGRLADQPRNLLRLYASLELGVALLSLVAFWLFLGLDGVYRTAHLLLPVGAVKWGVFVVAFVVISVPAALIGGALPVLTKQVLSGGGAEAREVLGRLYGANTLGAAFGAGLAVKLVQSFGYDVGYHLAVVGSLVTAALAFAMSRLEPSAPPEPLPVEPTVAPEASAAQNGDSQVIALDPRWLAAAFALSGFAALSYEVVWQRLLQFFFQGTLTSFAIILSTFLLGIGFGSVVTRRQRASVEQFAMFEALIAALALAGVPLVTAVAETGRDARVVFIAIVFAISFLFGAIFPLAGKLFLAARSGDGQVGRATGSITSANTLGSVAGSLGASFVLIPLVGTRHTLVLSAVANLVAALLVLTSARRLKSVASATLAFATVLGLGFWLSSDWLGRYYLATIGRPGYDLVAEKESSLQPVLVLEDAPGRRLLIGGGFESGEIDEARRQTQRLQAHLPMLLHPAPSRVLEIGYGVGEIARTVLLYHPERLDLVEIDPNMISVANDWFGALNDHASDHPEVRTHVMDGRQFLRVTDASYDVILTDSMIPVSELSLRMYSLEHFEAGKAHLAPGGVMVLWLPLYIGAERVRVMLRTFLEVFPQSVLWLPQAFSANEAFVVGFRDTATLDLERTAQRFEAVAKPDLLPFGWSNPSTYFASFVGGPSELAALVSDVTQLHRDRAPVLDFIPAQEDLGLAELLARIYGQARPVALDFMPEGSDLRADLMASLEADRAYQGVHTRAQLEAMFQNFPLHPAARLTVARLMSEAKRGDAAGDRETRARAALALSPWDVQANLVLMREAQAHGQHEEAVAFARRAQVLQPYMKEATAVLRQGPTP